MDSDLDKVAYSFFKIFAQYESYLKDKGYFSPSSNGGIIVDWDDFVNKNIGKDFMKQLGDKKIQLNIF